MVITQPRRRFTLITTDGDTDRATFAEEVQAGLTAVPKRLPCRYFYDGEGSLLFEAICNLPEYYLTRAEREILEARAGTIAALFPEPPSLVELGSGSAVKTRLLIEAFLREHGALCYVPVDISRTILEESSLALLDAYPALDILAVAGEYSQGLETIAGNRALGTGHGAKLILWLGSNVGNFERTEAAAFLARIRETMSPADRLLVGIDLRKDRAVLEPAYDDSLGITARFNRNILARVNRELGGAFDLDTFRHRAVYDEAIGRIEMYLVSEREQRVRIADLELEIPFAPGEAIHTENSYKYSLIEIDSLTAAAGLCVEHQWLDGAERFSASLLRVGGRR
jgi:dimethylhistidine N-methyltransferase